MNLFSQCYTNHFYLHSFPTRRSSDLSSLPRIRRRVDRHLRPYREYHAGRLGAIQELPLGPVEGPEVKAVIDGEDLSHRPRRMDDPEHAKPAIGPRAAGEAALDEVVLGRVRRRHQYDARARHVYVPAERGGPHSILRAHLAGPVHHPAADRRGPERLAIAQPAYGSDQPARHELADEPDARLSADADVGAEVDLGVRREPGNAPALDANVEHL